MSRLTFRLRFTALLLAAALAVPCAVAAAPSVRHQPAGTGLLQQLWTVFAGLWSAGVTPDSGCRMDPSGGCLPRSAPVPAIAPDSGCHMDPNGGCLPGS
jgi:hypothetical protein